MEFHHFGLILSALFGLIAVLTSWYLIWRHCTHYLKPWEQRQYAHGLLSPGSLADPSQYHTSPLHGTHILDRFLPLLSLLHPRRLLRGDIRVL